MTTTKRDVRSVAQGYAARKASSTINGRPSSSAHWTARSSAKFDRARRAEVIQ